MKMPRTVPESPAIAVRFGRWIGLAATVLTYLLVTLPQAMAAPSAEVPLSVGYLLGYMPYVGEKDGKLTGAEGELLNATAKALGRGVEIHGMEFSALLAGIQAGRYDVAIGDLAWSKQRAAAGIMTDPIYYSPHLILAQPELHLHTIGDLAGHTIGALSGAGVEKAIRQINGVTVHSYPTSTAAIGDLEARRIDALILDPLLLAYVHKTRPDLKDFVISTLSEPSAADLKQHPEVKDVTGLKPYMVVWYCSIKAKSFCDEADKQIAGWYRSGMSEKILTAYGADSDSFFHPPAGIEAARRGVDRSQDWIAPSARK